MLYNLYNIPCYNKIPLPTAPFINDRTSLPKIKRETNFVQQSYQRKEKQLLPMSYITYLVLMKCNFSIHLLKITGLRFLKVKQKHDLNTSVIKDRKINDYQ